MRLIDADLFDMSLVDAQAKCKRIGDNFRHGVLSNVRANLLKQPTVDAVPIDKLCEWLARNYEPVYNIDDIHNLTWPIDYSQQKEAWMKILKKLMKED